MKEKNQTVWPRREKEPPGNSSPPPAAADQHEEAGPSAVSQAAFWPPTEWELPKEHPLMWLWEFRNAEVGGLPPPRLSLASPEAPASALLSDAAEELLRLKQRVTDAAATRRRVVASKAAGGPIPDLDAEVNIYRSRDGLSAWAVIFSPVGKGRELTREMLSHALAGKQIVLGVDQDLLDHLPAREDRYFRLYLLARGVPPAHGRDGSIVDFFPRKVERKYAVNDQNQMDFTTSNLIHNVEEGTTICKIVPPTSGTPGVSVQGEILPARAGKRAEVPKGRNTKLSEDGSCLVAAASGHIIFTGRYFEVRCTLDIAGDVDYSTGNLNYLGDIHILGDVRSGFTVRAMGTIWVDGVIEDTSVEAGGDLIVKGGVQGNGKAVIRAHQNVYVKYLENCSAYIRGDLHSDCVINCEVYCDGAVHVKTGRGVILGGNTHSAEVIEANIVGARTEVRTVVTLGGCPCEDSERREVLQEIQEIERDLQRTERQPDSPAKKKRMSDLRLRTSISRMKLEKFKQRLAQRQEQPKDQHGRLLFKMVYPGTIISIDGYTQVVQQEVRSSTAVLINEAVHFV